MSEPPIFILKSAEEGAAHEREAVARMITRWADEPSRTTPTDRLKCLAYLVRRGEHHRPIDTAPRRRMGR